MCTVTYLPTAEGFILTSNRDEDPQRASTRLSRLEIADQQILFPLDSRAGGTWIAGSTSGRAVCVLNGAHHPYTRTPPYRRSRGLMALDSFSFHDADAFFSEYTFSGMEPFTLIMAESGALWDFRWNGRQTFLLPLQPDEPFIWSSASLYTPEASEQRASWFYHWLSQHGTSFTPEDVLTLHRSGGEGNREIDFVMERGSTLRTLSLTQLMRANSSMLLHHESIGPGSILSDSIPVKLVGPL
jgi:hypothetical protein